MGSLCGTPANRGRVCGKPNCKWAKGKKHTSVYLLASYQGRLRQLFIPKEFEPQVRRWVQQYQEARTLLEEIFLWVTTPSSSRASTNPVVGLGHSRWDIENQSFNEAVNQ